VAMNIRTGFEVATAIAVIVVALCVSFMVLVRAPTFSYIAASGALLALVGLYRLWIALQSDPLR
jgi:hypothetical protein